MHQPTNTSCSYLYLRRQCLIPRKDQYRTVHITICYYEGGRDITLQELVVMEGGQGRSQWPERLLQSINRTQWSARHVAMDQYLTVKLSLEF